MQHISEVLNTVKPLYTKHLSDYIFCLVWRGVIVKYIKFRKEGSFESIKYTKIIKNSSFDLIETVQWLS